MWCSATLMHERELVMARVHPSHHHKQLARGLHAAALLVPGHSVGGLQSCLVARSDARWGGVGESSLGALPRMAAGGNGGRVVVVVVVPSTYIGSESNASYVQ